MNMKMKRMLVSLMLVSAATVVCAADRTWNGGGSDANWGTAANWGGTAPSTNDVLYFGGAAKLVNTNDLPADTPFAGVTFNSGAGAFTLSGSGIALGGNVVNNDNDAQTLNLGLNLNAVRIFNASNGNLVANGELSGTGGVTKSGYYALTLAASNSYEGLTTISTGTVVITHANALGASSSGTTVNTSQGASLELRGGLTLAEPLTFTGANVNKSCFINGTGTNTISSRITTAGGRHFITGGTTLIITGGITNNPFFVINGTGTLIIRTTPLTLGTGSFYADDNTLTLLEVASNMWSSTTVAKGTVRMNVANALPPAAPIRMGLDYGPLGTLDLNGYDQTTVQLYTGTTNAGVRTVTSAAPATLTVNQSTPTSTFAGLFAGVASLLKAGTGTLILTNGISTTTGDITVSNGTLVVATTASLSGSTNVYVSGGTLELRAATTLSDSASLFVADGGAKVKVTAGLSETVNKLFFGGVQQMSGTWGTNGSGAAHIDSTRFTGGGLINVLSSPPVTAVNATWDAEGADTFVSTATNWFGDVLPAFDGTTYAIFATGGTTATVDSAVNLYGMTFNRSNDFTLAAGAGIITNGMGGLLAQVPNTTSRSYTLAEDVMLAENQTWCVTNNGAGGTTLTVAGTIDDGISPYNLTKSGNGVLVLSGGNTYDGTTTLKTNGSMRITHSSALGSTNGATTVENGGWLDMTGDINVAEAITINGDAATSYAGALRSNSGSNIWSGPIICNGSRIRVNGGSLDIVGGVTGSSLVVGANPGASLRFSQQPVNVGVGSLVSHTAGGAIILAVTNNVWSRLEAGNSFFRLDLPNALPPTASLEQGSASAKSSVVDLNGNNQTVGQLKTGYSGGPETRIIISATPVTLTVNQSVATEYNGSFTGAVSLVKLGTGSLLLSGTNSTFGGFSVSNGVVVVGTTGTLGNNSTNIVVGGTGTLALSNSVCIANSATVRMPNSGTNTAKISLGIGVNESVGYLFFGGVLQRVGTYGSTSSTAAVKDDTHFSGQGMLTVLHDKSGTMIKVQ